MSENVQKEHILGQKVQFQLLFVNFSFKIYNLRRQARIYKKWIIDKPDNTQLPRKIDPPTAKMDEKGNLITAAAPLNPIQVGL